MPLVRLPGGELRDEVRYPLIDGRQIEDGTDPSGAYSYFSSVQGKPDYLTNLGQNNILPQGVSFRIMGLAFDMQNLNPKRKTLLSTLLDHTSVRLRVGEKDYLKAPLLFVAGRLEQNAACSTGTATTTDIEHLHQKFGTAIGLPILLSGKHVVDIAPLQNFSVETITSGITAAELASLTTTPVVGLHNIIHCSLKGLMRRPVQ
jgi:hypothetical protein